MKAQSGSISNRLAELRERAGLSAATLAGMVQTTRQTIHAIEAGKYTPNTVLALRLARALQSTVEELFHLDDAAPSAPAAVSVDLIGDATARSGQPVQLCRVGDRLVGIPATPAPLYLPASDGVLTKPSSRSKPRAIPFDPSTLHGRLLIAGCDPAMSILAAHARRAGVEVVLAGCNSSQALDLLRKGSIHIAGTHLCDAAGRAATLAAIGKHFKPDTVRVITFAAWQQGLVVAPGNPKSIRTAADLARRGVRIVNREPGAGSRMLLDGELRRLGVKHDQIHGYKQIAQGHLPAAWHVLSGLADCCVATEAAARAFGLEFIPLRDERFDFVVPTELLPAAPVQRVLDTLHRLSFRNELNLLGGYDTNQTGAYLS